jgi:hypothetical protein
MCELPKSSTDGRRNEESAEWQQEEERCVLREHGGRLATL